MTKSKQQKSAYSGTKSEGLLNFGYDEKNGAFYKYPDQNNLMLSKYSKEFLKDLRVILPPRLRSLVRQSLTGLGEEMQQFVCDNITTFLRSGFMFKTGLKHVDQLIGLLMLELMNAKGINCPPF